eukprot:TRINITY_DN751_c0_g1_i1.p1 TRINITY_DN751_c0_g1~~TRINITY_DN751_c0_g1_i1.p1  ORF type:complete len:125 (-),score=30.91 TRINITY_DN751_c0_g1_i1:79-453(-)
MCIRDRSTQSTGKSHQKKMSLNLTVVAGALVAAGGILGYVKKGSKPSLIAGVTFGVLYGVSAYFLSTPSTSYRGSVLSIIVSVVLLASMGKRWAGIDFKFPSPPGIMTVLALIVALYNAKLTYF